MPFPKIQVPRKWRAALWSVAIGLLAALIPLHLANVEAHFRANHESYLRNTIAKLDAVAYDGLFHHRGPEPILPEVVIVEINPNIIVSIQDKIKDQQGKPVEYPFPRRLHAQLLRKLKKAGAKVIGIDILFDLPSRYGLLDDEAFAQAIKACGNVILAANFQPSRTADADELGNSLNFPLPDLRAAALGFGPVNIAQDVDGHSRRFDLTQRRAGLEDITQDYDYPGFATRIAAAYQGISEPELLAGLKKGQFGTEAIHYAPEDFQSHVDSRKVRICYAGYPKLACRYVGYDQVLFDDTVKPEQRLPADFFKGKIVLIGTTEEEEHDTYLTPLRRDEDPKRPGVEVHANIIHTLLANHYYATFPEDARVFLVWGLALMMALGTLLLKPLRALPLLLLILGSIFASMFALFSLRVVLAPTQLFAAPLLSFGLATVYFYLVEERRAKEIRARFGKHVGPRVVEKLLNEDRPLFTQERYYATVMFTDLQGFTTLSEKMDAAEAVALLNKYLDQMVEILWRYDGTLDKIMGDGIMAYFNAPDPVPNHEQRAVDCALEMQRVMQEWRSLSEKLGVPPLKVRIGIHSGDVTAGAVGSRTHQVNYTVIGDTVNIAARLEPLNKEFHTEIMISEAVFTGLTPATPTTYLGEVTIRGRQEGIRAYGVSAAVEERAQIAVVDEGIRAYNAPATPS